MSCIQGTSAHVSWVINTSRVRIGYKLPGCCRGVVHGHDTWPLPTYYESEQPPPTQMQPEQTESCRRRLRVIRCSSSSSSYRPCTVSIVLMFLMGDRADASPTSLGVAHQIAVAAVGNERWRWCNAVSHRSVSEAERHRVVWAEDGVRLAMEPCIIATIPWVSWPRCARWDERLLSRACVMVRAWMSEWVSWLLNAHRRPFQRHWMVWRLKHENTQ